MGVFAARTFRELTAARRLPVGPWLADARAQHPVLDVPVLVLRAALGRLDYIALLEGATTYAGKEGDVGLGAQMVSTYPSQIWIDGDGRATTITLGALTVNAGGIHHAVDWEVGLTLADDLRSVLLEVGAARTVDGSLANDKVFKRLLEAVADVLLHGVAIEQVPVSGGGDVEAALSLMPLPGGSRIALRPRNAVYLHGSWTSFFSIVDPAVPQSVRERLAAIGSWPLMQPDGDRLRITVNEEQSMRLIGAILEQFCTGDKPARDNDVRTRLAELSDVDEYLVADESPRNFIDSSSRHYFYAIEGMSRLGSRSFGATASAACDVAAEDLRIGKLRGTTQRVYWRAAFDGRSVGYGTALDYTKVGLQGRLPPGSPHRWRTFFSQERTEPDAELRRVYAIAGAAEYGRLKVLDGSDTLLQMLGWCAEVLASSGDGPATLWRVDRRRDWGSTSPGIPTGGTTTSRPHQSDWAPPTAGHTSSAPTPGASWLPDPTGRHQHRYWDGSRWTEHVSDGGVASTDPV